MMYNVHRATVIKAEENDPILVQYQDGSEGEIDLSLDCWHGVEPNDAVFVLVPNNVVFDDTNRPVLLGFVHEQGSEPDESNIVQQT